MTVTIAILAERALRRLGVDVVPASDRPALNTQVAPADVAASALVDLGIIAADAVPPSQAVVIPLDTIATLALTKLGVIASDETPIATDMTLARDAVNAVHASLVGKGLADWTAATITNAVSEEYAGLGAGHLAASFGKAVDPAMIPMLEARVAEVTRVRRAMETALGQLAYVQASLVSQGLVNWPNTGIPTAVSDEYKSLVGIGIASSFGKDADDAQTPMLEARIKRFARIQAAPDSAEKAVMAVHDNLAARGLARWSVFDIPVAAELPYEMLAANRLAPLFEQQANAGEEELATRSLLQIIALPTSGERVRAEYF